MPASPPPPDPRFRKPAKIVVLLGPDDGSAPAITDRVDYLRPISLTRDFGGGTLDSITLDFDLAKYGSRLQDTSLPSGHNRIIEIRVENPLTGKLDQCRGFGKLARQPQQIGTAERVGFVARLDHFMFGSRLTGYPVFDPQVLGGGVILIERPMTFNPEIDDTRFPNRSNREDEHTARLFLHPESIRTAAAKTFQVATATRWDLATAVERICWTLNADETWFKNPKLLDLQAVLGIGTSLLENHTIALQASLPEALDQLLAPHGFTWFVKHSIDTADAELPRTSTIVVAERGKGLPITLRLQRLEDKIDSSKTNIDSVNIAYDIAARPNMIIGRSALAVREGTFFLRPAWPKADDSLSKADLTEELKEHDREHIDVMRKFVFDTAGDYIGLRDDFAAAPNDLADLFDQPTVPIRRRFKPALTQGLDRQPIGVNGFFLQWNNGNLWESVPWSFSVLEHEAGILLERGVDEEFRVEFLKKTAAVAAGSTPDPILRITCCLEADFAFQFAAERRDESANGSDIPRIYDLSHKFQDARVISAGPFASVLYDLRHKSVIATTVGGSTSSVIVAGDLSDVLKSGDRITIMDSDDNDGVYHVESIAAVSGSSTILLREPLASIASVGDGVMSYLTNEEKPDTPLRAYCEEIQAEEDFVVIHADATLFGVDHPEYDLGYIVEKIEQRNLSLDSYAAAAVTQRHPQITRIVEQYDAQQTISLTLDQYDRVSDRGRQRLLKK